MVAFRFQAVLNVRKIEEEKLQGELAGLVIAAEEAEKKLNFLRFQKAQSQKVLHERQVEGLSASEIGIFDAYLNDLERQISQQKKLLKKLTEAREKKREDLLVASKKRKILEKLKEKALIEALSEETARHQNFIDEMGIVRHVRKTNLGPEGN